MVRVWTAWCWYFVGYVVVLGLRCFWAVALMFGLALRLWLPVLLQAVVVESFGCLI